MNALPGQPMPPAPVPAAATPVEAAPPMSPRTRRLLHGPIVPTLLLLAWPNVLVMMAQASTGLIETWFVSRLGTAALAGMALVFPGFMMMTMLSAGGEFRLLFDGTDHTPFAITLEVRSVDLNGNVGPATLVSVSG